MFRLLKKIRGEDEALPTFARYYTSRKSWFADYEECESIYSPHPNLSSKTSLSDIPSAVQMEADFGEDVDDHIYEEIDDVAPQSNPLEDYITAITSLTLQIESDFGSKKAHSSTNERNTSTVSSKASVQTQCSPSLRTMKCQEKCEKWLSDLASVNPADFEVPMSPILPSCDDMPDNRSSKRRSKINIRKMSVEKRQELLRKIEDNWFASSDESSDESYPSLVSQESSSRLIQFSCVSHNQNQSQLLRSTSEESSGIFEDNSRGDTGFSDSVNNLTGSDSAFSEMNGQNSFSYRPKIGFGLNRWYRPRE